MIDESSTPGERLEELTSLYERRAYMVWNVALRTALLGERATGAACGSFVAQVQQPDEHRVAFDVARAAAEGAAPVDPRALDDPVLAATARLAPAQRAMLALAALADASSEEIAWALGIAPAVEQDLRARAYEQLGALLGVPADEAERRYADLPWLEPPEELWATLYPELHAAVTRHGRAEAGPASTAQPAQPSRGGLVRRMRTPRVALVAVAVLGLAGVAWATSGDGGSKPTGEEPGYSATSSGSDTPPPASAYSDPNDAGTTDQPNLTPEELDRLRQEEVEDLKRFVRQKENKRLPVAARRHAARKVSDLVKLAQARQQAAERRELAIRRQLAREREARMRERARREEAERESEPTRRRDETPPSREQPALAAPAPREDRDRDDREERTPDEQEAECLYDAGSGTYICPE